MYGHAQIEMFLLLKPALPLKLCYTIKKALTIKKFRLRMFKLRGRIDLVIYRKLYLGGTIQA